MHLVRMASIPPLSPKAWATSAEQDAIELAAPMHDIGKIASRTGLIIPEGGREDCGTCSPHARIATTCEGQSQAPAMAAVIALGHHEKFDGSVSRPV